MEKAIYYGSLSEDESEYNRIYIGEEFCENLIPTIIDVKKILSKFPNKKFSLLTPPLTDYGIKKISQIIRKINS